MNNLKTIDATDVSAPQSGMVSLIERVLHDETIPFDKLERMLAMQERIEAGQARNAFNAAFASAVAEFPSIPLNGKGHNKMPYALLKDIVGITRPILARYGLSLNWEVEITDRVKVTACLRHTLGHVTTTSIVLPADTSGSKNPVQALGSSQTYGERYTAQAILGLSLGDDTDDDGAAAGSSTINEEQFNTLFNLMVETGSDDSFLRIYGVEDPRDLPAKMFKPAIYLLEQKLAKKKAAANA